MCVQAGQHRQCSCHSPGLEGSVRDHASLHLILRSLNSSPGNLLLATGSSSPGAQGTERENSTKPVQKGKGKNGIAFSLSETCVYWKIFTAGKGEIAGLISTEKAGMAGRCLWIYINPKDPATTVCFASCTLGVEVVMTAAPLPLPMPPFPA